MSIAKEISSDKNETKPEPTEIMKKVQRLTEVEDEQDTDWGPFSLLINYCQRRDETKANYRVKTQDIPGHVNPMP